MTYLVTTNLDIGMLILYFAVLIGNGIYFSLKKTKHGDDFLLGGSSFGVFATLCTQGATMKGSGALLGYSAGAYANGTGVLISSQCYSIGAWIAVLSGIARKIRKCASVVRIRSAGDLFERRFESPILKKMAGIGGGWLALSILSSQMAALGLLVHLLFGKYGLSFEAALIIGVVVAVIYTSVGGLVSVVYNDVFQWLVMTPMIFLVLPGMLLFSQGITPQALHSALDSVQYFSLRPNIWWLGYLLSGVLAACSDVSHLTRFIAAKDERTAVTGSMLGFAYCTLFAGVIIYFGLSATVLVKPEILGGNNDGVLFALISQILPAGLVGLFVAAILATTISTLDSYLQVSVVCLMIDVIEPVLPATTSDRQKLTYCRLITVIIALLAASFVLKVKGILAVVSIGYSVYSSGMFLPLMCCMFWKKATEKGCLGGMLAGAGSCIVALQTKLPLPIVWGVAASLIVTVGLSLATYREDSARALLPGFDEQGLKIDADICKASILGAIGSLLISIGIGMWVNWICIIIGAAGLWACIALMKRAFDQYLPAAKA